MTLNPQTANFPPIHQPEQSWEHDLRAIFQALYPVGRVWSGLVLGLPISGLTPTLTDGVVLYQDQVIGPYGSKLISPAPASSSRMGLYFGLKGMYYAELGTETPGSVLVGEVTTDATGIVSLVQYFNYGPGRVGVKGIIDLVKCPLAADTPFATVELENFTGLRVAYAHARTAIAGATTTAGDQVLIKHGGTTLITHNKAALDAAGTLTLASPGAAQVQPTVPIINFAYNATEATRLTAGVGEFAAEGMGLL